MLELLGRENVNVSSKQVKDLINLLIQEEKLEDERKKKIREDSDKQLDKQSKKDE